MSTLSTPSLAPAGPSVRSFISAWCLAALASLLFAGSSFAADFGVESFDGQVNADPGGAAFTQAGGHPYDVAIQMRFNSRLAPVPPFPGEFTWPAEPVKDIIVDSPPGLIGNPTATSKCPANLLSVNPIEADSSLCPAGSQVGTVRLVESFPGLPGDIMVTAPLGVFNLVAPPNVPARFGFSAGGTIVTFDAELRSGSDYGLSINSLNTSTAIPILGANVNLWGVPADPIHDSERFCPGSTVPGCTTEAPIRPFLTLPTACTPAGVGLETRLRVSSWVKPDVFRGASFFSHLPPNAPDPLGPQQGPTGCEKVPFTPELDVTPLRAASPGASGYAFDLSMPQGGLEIPGAIAQGHLKKAVVTFPEGVRVSPSAAAGLGACSPAQIGLSNSGEPTCPDNSKIGTLEIETPLLEEPLTGSIYLATPFDNPSRSLIAIYLVARGPGLVVKISGGVTPDASTGRLQATFDNQPQVPFSNLHLEFFGGERASLSNPPRCGTYTVRAEMTSWSGATATSESSFTTSHDGRGAPCPAERFSPTLTAGTINPQAGASTPFTFALARTDEDDELKAIRSIEMPAGLLARIADVPLCPTEHVIAGSCDDASRIGTVTTAAGPGPNPFSVRGSVYIGGPYHGAPFSLSIVVPVVAGPFDLGKVVVRSAIFVDRHDATLSLVTEELPTVLQGIPLQVRLVNVLIDRPNFILNPTSCRQQQITADVAATTGRTAQPRSRFQIGGCRALDFRPRLALRAGGRGRTQRGRTTPFSATVSMPAGNANLKSVRVTLPKTLNARLDVVNDACTRAEFESGNCEDARAGTAVATTPLLRDPLRGGVYFVRNGNPLPDVFVALRGQVDFDLIGRVSIPGSTRLATTFDTAPDVPIRRFALRFVGGRRGPVGNAANLCTRRARRSAARVVYTSQSGEQISRSERIAISGCRRARRARRARK